MLINEGGKLIAYPAEGEPHEFDTREEILIPTGINLPPTGMFYRELGHFIDCVRRGAPSDLVTRQQVLTVIELLEEISQA